VTLIDLRRFLGAGDRLHLTAADGGELMLDVEHVAPRWATLLAPHGRVPERGVLRGELARNDLRAAARFDVLHVEPRDAICDVVEVAVADVIVLGERRAPRSATGAEHVTVVQQRPDRPTVRVGARVIDVSSTGIAFQAEDRFAIGDELVLLAESAHRFQVSIRVVHRERAPFGRVQYGCQVVAASAADRAELRALMTSP
jgi:hypothetical protein